MDLRTLRYFVATVEAGSISAASTRCHVAQPSITLAIAKLEDELSCKLFDRHRKGSSPTEDGKKMYTMALELLQHAESIKHQFLAKEKVRTITLAVDKNIRVALLEKLLIDANSTDAKFEFKLLSDDQSEHKSVNADLRLTTKSQAAVDEIFIPLSTESYAVLIPNSYLLAYQNDLKPIDLNHQNIISRIHCENHGLFDQMVDQLGIELNTVAKVETEEWAHALVGSGLGLTFAPVPDDFSDARFMVRPIIEFLGIETPKRVVGLAVKKIKLEEFQSLLPGIIQS